VIEEAVRDILVGYTPLTTLLDTYEFSTGVASPAVFTTGRLPTDALGFCLRVEMTGGQLDKTALDRCPDGTAWDATVSVWVNGDKRRTLQALRAVVQEAYLALHMQTTDTDDVHVYVLAQPPRWAPADESFPRYLIVCSVKAWLLKARA